VMNVLIWAHFPYQQMLSEYFLCKFFMRLYCYIASLSVLLWNCEILLV